MQDQSDVRNLPIDIALSRLSGLQFPPNSVYDVSSSSSLCGNLFVLAMSCGIGCRMAGGSEAGVGGFPEALDRGAGEDQRGIHFAAQGFGPLFSDS